MRLVHEQESESERRGQASNTSRENIRGRAVQAEDVKNTCWENPVGKSRQGGTACPWGREKKLKRALLFAVVCALLQLLRKRKRVRNNLSVGRENRLACSRWEIRTGSLVWGFGLGVWFGGLDFGGLDWGFGFWGFEIFSGPLPRHGIRSGVLP